MVRVSNSLVGFLNFITVLLSVAILAGGLWLRSQAGTACENFLDEPFIALGAFIMLVSVAGLIGAWRRVSWLLHIYLFVMLILICLVFCFTIFSFVVTNKGAGEVVSGRGYKEYRLGDYSNWLQKRVNSTKNWRKIKSCMQESKVCNNLEDKNLRQSDFFNLHLSPLKSGCCKPPTACNLSHQSATNWTKPADSTTYSNQDCTTWSNDPNSLCYDCQSCKEGFVANLKEDWKKVALVNVVVFIFLIIVYSVGCCSVRNNREDNANSRWKVYA